MNRRGGDAVYSGSAIPVQQPKRERDITNCGGPL